MFTSQKMKSGIQAQSDCKTLCAFVLHEKESNVFVTQHQVKNNKMGLGKLVDFGAVQNLFEQKKETANIDSDLFLPSENIVLDNFKTIVWYTKSQKRAMWFRTNNGVNSFMVRWPSLLFIASKQRNMLQVFALATSSRPTLSSKLYDAPIMNVSSNGVVCQGSATLPKLIEAQTIVDMENTIYESQFTHINDARGKENNALNSTENNLRYWKSKSKNNQRVYAKELIFHSTLKSELTK